MMDREVREIEVEVVDADVVEPRGVLRGSPAAAERGAEDWKEWRHWQGRAKTLDLRWWPLWLVLGGIAVFLLLTLGLVIAVIYGVLRLVGWMLRALAR